MVINMNNYINYSGKNLFTCLTTKLKFSTVADKLFRTLFQNIPMKFYVGIPSPKTLKFQ